MVFLLYIYIYIYISHNTVHCGKGVKIVSLHILEIRGEDGIMMTRIYKKKTCTDMNRSMNEKKSVINCLIKRV